MVETAVNTPTEARILDQLSAMIENAPQTGFHVSQVELDPHVATSISSKITSMFTQINICCRMDSVMEMYLKCGK